MYMRSAPGVCSAIRLPSKSIRPLRMIARARGSLRRPMKLADAQAMSAAGLDLGLARKKYKFFNLAAPSSSPHSQYTVCFSPKQRP
jgi:hypothetical protein